MFSRDPLYTPIELTDGLVLLRLPRLDDAPALAAAVSESLPELQPWMDWATSAFDEAAARRWLEVVRLGWEHKTAFHFAVTDAKTGQYLGNCGIDGVNPTDRTGNLGYWVRTSRIRQGVASRAAHLAAGFAFDTLGLVRIEIVIASGNLASRRTAEKIGAHYEGARKKPLVVRTALYDAALYSLTAADVDAHPR